jgi:hypothetical protein
VATDGRGIYDGTPLERSITAISCFIATNTTRMLMSFTLMIMLDRLLGGEQAELAVFCFLMRISCSNSLAMLVFPWE